jgi:hypothetical protein
MINKNQQVLVGALSVVIVLMFGNTNLGSASGVGLKVNVFINQASCVIGQTADITLSTSQDFTEFKSVMLASADTVTHFQFAPGEVPIGDSVFANVDINDRHVGD